MSNAMPWLDLGWIVIRRGAVHSLLTAVHPPYVERVNSGQGIFFKKLSKTVPLHLGTLYICHFHFRSVFKSQKSYFSLREYFLRKIHKNSPLYTQSHSLVHKRPSCIIYGHIGYIHAWYVIITSWLVRKSLISSNFSVFYI